MSKDIIEVGSGFWNIRGTFKIAGLLNVGTHSSLVQRKNGRFVLLDAYTFDQEVLREVKQITDGGDAIDAVLNLHPFHTIHVEKTHAQFPQAKLYGTARHLARQDHLPWETLTTDDPLLHDLFDEDLLFSVPQGVDFISADENVHFSSVLAMHPASKTIHSDDTFNYLAPSGLLKLTPLGDSVSFHPTLAKALEPHSDAAQDFREWATRLMDEWRSAENLCAAHTGALLARDNQGDDLHTRLQNAFKKVASTLDAHEAKFSR